MRAALSAAGIGALVVVNAVAFVAVDEHFKVKAQAAPNPSSAEFRTSSTASSPPATSHPAASTPAASSSEASPQKAELTADAVRSPGVFVIATNANRAWRAVNSGDCHGSVTVQATTDGGRTWSDKSASPAGAADGISINGEGKLQLSGQAADGCKQDVWALDGDSWSSTKSTSWMSGGLQSGDVLHDGRSTQACDTGTVIDIAIAGDTADVLCSTGEVRTVPADGSVKTIYQSSDALSIGTTGDNTLIIARTAKGCDGVQLAKVTDGSAQPIICVSGASKAVDLTFTGSNGWLVAAHNTWTGKATGEWTKS